MNFKTSVIIYKGHSVTTNGTRIGRKIFKETMASSPQEHRRKIANSHLNVPSGSDLSDVSVSSNTRSRPIPSSYPNNSNKKSTNFPITQNDILHYLQRMIDVQQMDIQSAIDQMVTLCTFHPQRVYKTAYYRKQTKNHWARDDPAFAMLQIIFLFLSSTAYCFAFRNSEYMTASGIVMFALRNILINWAGFGLITATLGRAIANGYCSTVQNKSAEGSNGTTPLQFHVKQKVEWLYAFDIHCNAFFPFFIMIYVIQFFLLPLVLGASLFSLILSNTIYVIGFSWYFYVTHLGYRGKL